ncbi:MAG: hypothetical protein LBV53_01100 [Mycoplasmataceae bacterium]|nr:hypothetical protein [Mycoplasmataceae bacterium]
MEVRIESFNELQESIDIIKKIRKIYKKDAGIVLSILKDKSIEKDEIDIIKIIGTN